MSAPYPLVNGTLVNNDLSQLFVYANSVTDGMFMLFMTIAFFFIILIGSIVATIRTSARPRFELAFAAASFATFGFTMILSTVDGLINPLYLFISAGLTIIGVVWIFLSSD